MVPKKGLEPPHPCEYVDLNHARLPIPPLRHGTQVQHFLLNRQHLRVSQMQHPVSNLTGEYGPEHYAPAALFMLRTFRL